MAKQASVEKIFRRNGRQGAHGAAKQDCGNQNFDAGTDKTLVAGKCSKSPMWGRTPLVANIVLGARLPNGLLHQKLWFEVWHELLSHCCSTNRTSKTKAFTASEKET